MSFAELSVREFLEQVAAATPTPGGGAVAALTAALAAALAEMVVNHSAGDRGVCVAALSSLRSRALRLADDDAEAFGALSSLWKLPRDDERRRSAWEPAVKSAIDAPERVMQVAVEVLQALEHEHGLNANLASDLVIAARLAETAAHAAAVNVQVNLPLLADRSDAAALAAKTQERLETIRVAADALASSTLS